jgi:hypothetical protein
MALGPLSMKPTSQCTVVVAAIDDVASIADGLVHRYPHFESEPNAIELLADLGAAFWPFRIRQCVPELVFTTPADAQSGVLVWSLSSKVTGYVADADADMQAAMVAHWSHPSARSIFMPRDAQACRLVLRQLVELASVARLKRNCSSSALPSDARTKHTSGP